MKPVHVFLILKLSLSLLLVPTSAGDEFDIPIEHVPDSNDDTLSSIPVLPSLPNHLPLLTMPTQPKPSRSYRRTVIFIRKESVTGEHLFIRGGAAGSGQPIRIRHITNIHKKELQCYKTWKEGDRYLDWDGNESDQTGVYKDVSAGGTPLVWTTNKPGASYYHKLNTYDSHYWMVDLAMDCSATNNGWFEFKAYVKKGNDGWWENDIHQNGQCQFDESGDIDKTSFTDNKNHVGLCGMINVYEYGQGSCSVESFP